MFFLFLFVEITFCHSAARNLHCQSFQGGQFKHILFKSVKHVNILSSRFCSERAQDNISTSTINIYHQAKIRGCLCLSASISVALLDIFGSRIFWGIQDHVLACTVSVLLPQPSSATYKWAHCLQLMLTWDTYLPYSGVDTKLVLYGSHLRRCISSSLLMLLCGSLSWAGSVFFAVWTVNLHVLVIPVMNWYINDT